MQIEVVTIPVTELQGIITDAVAKDIQMAKQNEILEDEFISVSDACEIANKSRSAIIAWCTKHNIGNNTTGSWTISKNKLLKILTDKR